jgi:hypothetical protein
MCSNRSGFMKATSDEIMDAPHRGHCTFFLGGVWKHCTNISHSATHSSLLTGAGGSTRSRGGT